ncbi:DNA-formamidopyrimidine glycosylase family protein [Taibaiella soli]|uniref:Fpg/Nei family DNA glycosylase n=1 Tax=Taibaiella soli TaxID=1649169 RepID=A0A2W2AFL1_9BACT|nr:DNA-formamidopyrimidine glycosylase family protein [Taibaiella soli]PZF72292.1 Fpg/Nei family DNA glycosylase [Taibaiella soli]
MPELPDLSAFSHNLQKKLKGKTIRNIEIHSAKKLNATHADFEKALKHQTFKKIVRDGKELYFTTKDGTVVALHLMLRGQLFVDDKEHKSAVVTITFDDDTKFTMADYQGLANIRLNPEEPDAPDALATSVTLSYFRDQLASTKATIKNFLLDQHNLRGIGNAYADEILWDARISPFSICSKIPEEQVEELYHSIRKVLEHAEKQILKSNPDIISGEVRDFMVIHNASKTESPDGAKIHQKVAGGRKTYYTDEQELFK